MSDSIPIIDISNFMGGSESGLRGAASQVHDALTKVGFFILTGHGVPQDKVDRTFAAAARLHDLPMAKKLALKMNEHNNGYMAMGHYAITSVSNVDDNEKPDLNEGFFIRRERPANDPVYASGRRFLGPNRWPGEADLPGFRADALDYIDTIEAFGQRFLPVAAVSLGLHADWFNPFFAESYYSLRLNHYPPAQAEEGQYGIAPHTDSNFLTFLPQSGIPGLQVRMPDETWLDVPHVPGSFVVNSGRILQIWSNGLYKSSPHRAPPRPEGHRYAIPFFFGPSWDAAIECLATCRGPDNSPQWPPTTYGDVLTTFYDANYDHRDQESAVA